MVTRINKATDIWVGEILGDGEGSWIGRYLWQSERSKVFFEMTDESIADTFAVQHSTRHQHAANRSIRSDSEQQTHLSHSARFVHTNWNRIHIDEGHIGTNRGQQIWTEPRSSGIDLITHK